MIREHSRPPRRGDERSCGLLDTRYGAIGVEAREDSGSTGRSSAEGSCTLDGLGVLGQDVNGLG